MGDKHKRERERMRRKERVSVCPSSKLKGRISCIGEGDGTRVGVDGEK